MNIQHLFLLSVIFSIDRIEQYLNEREIVPPQSINVNDPVVIGFKNATVGYKLHEITTASSFPSSLPSSSLSLFDSNAKTLTTSRINEEDSNSEGFILK